jgi:hypothetical protein
MTAETQTSLMALLWFVAKVALVVIGTGFALWAIFAITVFVFIACDANKRR